MIQRTIRLMKEYYQDVVVLLICISIFWVVLYRFIPVPATLLMVKRIITSSSEYDFSYQWKSWDQISAYPKVCVMASEDQMLPFHNGLDLASLEDAITAKGKKRIRGASTVTQQVAKNVYLWPGRSFIRKGFELYFAGLIEAIWTKERILEVYLNVAETGQKCFGFEAAARRYYKKPASKLNLQESAMIVATLPNPIKYKALAPGNYLIKRKSQIVDLFNSLDGKNYLRELYVRSDKSLYDFSKYN
jgi:monofunctional biosynthetic peptidoglycan transglycosylase